MDNMTANKAMLFEPDKEVMVYLKMAQWVLNSKDADAIGAITSTIVAYVSSLSNLKMNKLEDSVKELQEVTALKQEAIAVKTGNVVHGNFRILK